jgi:hypothetical protein
MSFDMPVNASISRSLQQPVGVDVSLLFDTSFGFDANGDGKKRIDGPARARTSRSREIFSPRTDLKEEWSPAGPLGGDARLKAQDVVRRAPRPKGTVTAGKSFCTEVDAGLYVNHGSQPN